MPALGQSSAGLPTAKTCNHPATMEPPTMRRNLPLPTIFNPPPSSSSTSSLPCSSLPPNLNTHLPRHHGSTSTLSSTSSAGSSLRSRLSSLASSSSFSSKSSSSLPSPKPPIEFWAQFDRKSTQRKSISVIFKELFFAKSKQKEAAEDIYEIPEGDSNSSDEEGETSFSNEPLDTLDTCPSGLYCVIDDFLSEYEMRLFEEEERARLLQKQKSGKT